MKRRFQEIVIIVLVILTFTSCKHNSEEEKLYLSIAATYYDDGITPENGMSTLIYKYDLNQDVGNVVDNVVFNSQYPLAIYSQDENVIYYTSYDEVNRGDQIWCYDIENDTTVELTTNISVVNYIIPYDDYLVIIGRERMERRIKPMIYDKKSKEIYDVTTQEVDFQCDICTYNPITDILLMMGTSEVQKDELREEWNEGGGSLNPNPYYPPDTYIYKLNGKEAELVLKLESYEVANISSDLEGNIYYNGLTQKHSDVPMTYYRYILKTNQIEEFEVIADESPFEVREDYFFISDNEIVFRGYAKDEEEEDEYPYGVYLYNLDTEEFKLLFEGREYFDSYINNFIILKK